MKKCVDLLNTKEYSLLIDTTFKHNDLPNVNPKCVVPENIHSPLPSPPRRALKLVLPPPRWNFLSRSACSRSSILLSTYMFCIFVLVFTVWVEQNLCLSPTSSAKEPVTFKLNTTWTFVFSFQSKHVRRRLRTRLNYGESNVEYQQLHNRKLIHEPMTIVWKKPIA